MLAGIITESKYAAELNEDYKDNAYLEYDSDGKGVTLHSNSGEYYGSIEDNGQVSFSVVYEPDEDGYDLGDQYNNEEIFFEEEAPKIFRYLNNNSSSATYEAIADYIQITLDAEDLKRLVPEK